MKNLIDNIMNSFKSNKLGFSSRKLTAFIIVSMVILTHIKWLTLGNLTQLEMVLTIDYAFIASLFGMTTYTSLKANKTETPVEEPPIEEPKEDEKK